MGKTKGVGIRGAWARRDVKLLLSGVSVSSAGDWLYGIALIVFVYDRTGSAFWVGLASILRLLPYMIFSPFAGAIGDRHDKRRVMLISDLARAAIMTILTLVAFTDLHVLVVIILAFLTTTMGTLYGPALSAAIPHFVDEDELAGMNALISAVDTTALVIGPAVGGLLLILGSPALAFGVNAATFLVSAATLLLIRTTAQDTEGAERQHILREITDGIRAVVGAKDALVVVIFIMGASFLYGQELVLTVLVAKERLGIGSEGVGWLDAAVGVGGLLVAVFTAKIAAARRADTVLMMSIICCGLPLALLALTREVSIALIFMTVIGVGTVLVDVVGTTILQRSLRKDLLARVFGLIDSAGVAAILAGTLIAPAIVNLVGLQGALVVAGLMLPAIALVTFRRIGKINTAAAAGKVRLEPVLALLRSMPIFKGAPQPALERLAGSAEHITVGPGTTVVVEGEPADHFYVVEEGSFEVLFSGMTDESVRINEMGAGDHFGEIGLLERIPRTATVRSITEATFYRIDGKDFIESLSYAPVLPAALVKTTRTRLARTHPERSPTI
jgi:MFS family permease